MRQEAGPWVGCTQLLAHTGQPRPSGAYSASQMTRMPADARMSYTLLPRKHGESQAWWGKLPASMISIPADGLT